MAVSNNILLAILFSALNGLFLALASAIPSWFANKDRKIEEKSRKFPEDTREDNSSDELSYEEETNPQDNIPDTFDSEEFKEHFDDDKMNDIIHAMIQETTEEREEEDQEKEETTLKKKTSPCMWRALFITSTVIQFIAAVFAYFALLYGPVSVCTPIMSCSLIIFGVIIMSYILHLEAKPNKESRVGNCIILASVILVVFAGPIVDSETQLPSKKELQEQLLAPTSAAIILVMMGIFILTLPHIFIVIFHEKGSSYFSDSVNFVLFQASMLIMGSFMASCTKLFNNTEGWFFWANIGLFILFFVAFPIVTMYKSMCIKNPATFVSINSGLTYLLNVVVGLVCWRDQIRNWGGYVISWTLFILGMYLVSDVDILQEWGKENAVNPHTLSSDSEDAQVAHFSVIPNTRFSVVPTLHFSFTPTNSPTRFSIVNRRTLPGHVFNGEDNYSC